jgi:hypothetical protein
MAGCFKRARISLVVTQVVPYPLPLDRPPAQEFSERHFRVIAGESRVDTNVAGVLLPRSNGDVESRAQATLPGGRGGQEAVVEPCVANARETISARAAPHRARSDFFRNGVRHHAGYFCVGWAVCFCLLGLSLKPATSSTSYIIAGIASFGLLIYLVYALLLARFIGCRDVEKA